MDCKTIRERCAALPDAPDPEIAEHLAACADCRAAVEAMRETRALLDAWPRIESPVDVASVLAAAEVAERSELAQLAVQHRWRSTWIGLAAGILAFVSLSVVGTRVETGGGSLRITFGETHQAVGDTAMHDLVEREVIAKLEPVVKALVAATERSATLQREMLGELAGAVDYENQKDRALDAARERRLVDGVITAIAYGGKPHQP